MNRIPSTPPARAGGRRRWLPARLRDRHGSTTVIVLGLGVLIVSTILVMTMRPPMTEFFHPSDRQAHTYLRAVDEKAHALAAANGQTDPRPYLGQAAQSMPANMGTFSWDTTLGIVTLHRAGSCWQLTASTSTLPGYVGSLCQNINGFEPTVVPNQVHATSNAAWEFTWQLSAQARTLYVALPVGVSNYSAPSMVKYSKNGSSFPAIGTSRIVAISSAADGRPIYEIDLTGDGLPAGDWVYIRIDGVNNPPKAGAYPVFFGSTTSAPTASQVNGTRYSTYPQMTEGHSTLVVIK